MAETKDYFTLRALDEHERQQRLDQFELEMERVDAGLQTREEAILFLRHLNETVFSEVVVLHPAVS